MDYINDAGTLSERLRSLELEISTVDAGDASSGNTLYVNVVFSDGTRLYEPYNHRISESLPDKGEAKRISLPITPFVNRTLGDISEFFLRKSGSNGWFMGSALLFANDHSLPLIGNRNANQFLDNDDAVLQLRDWSTESFCVAPKTNEEHPLPRSGYRILGPVLGQVSDNSAVVLYRVDREGHYRFVVRDNVTSTVIFNEVHELEPTGRFELTGLLPDRRYNFELSFVRAGVETIVPNAAGSFQTYPEEGSFTEFTLAFGSCANPRKQAAQGAWLGIRALSRSATNPVKLFVHLGDTFYFYDDMTEETVKNVESMHGAHISQRRHIEFLDMAREVPCCGVWDDHDFAKDNTDSSDIDYALKVAASETWMQYWGNNQPIITAHDLGLTTRISYGLIDVYLLDGRYNRDRGDDICFGNDLITDLIETIRQRGMMTNVGRVVVLATGSSWTQQLNNNKEKYGHPDYKPERDVFYAGLRSLMGREINGLILLSGDSHINEIYHVDLGAPDGDRFAPEFSSSPLTKNSGGSDSGRKIEGERVASFPTTGSDGRRGFATLTIDVSNLTSEGTWTSTIRYYQEAGAAMYEERVYRLERGQFVPIA